MKRELTLGVIGESEGNGHPYSWSAIFNGFNKEAMSLCPYPVISKYLNEEKYPENFINNASVTHIWTQNITNSIRIAKASKIPNIVENYLDLIGKVDAILIARDDASNHYKQSKEFIELGIPIYIDKPFTLSITDAIKILSLVEDRSKLFTCSALSFSPALKIFAKSLKSKGRIISINASIRGNWEKYSMHLIEPILKHFILWNQKFFIENKIFEGKKNVLNFKSEDNVRVKITTDEEFTGKPIFKVTTTKGIFNHIYNDTFNAFKNSLENFIATINKEIDPLDFDFIKKTVYLLESGK